MVVFGGYAYLNFTGKLPGHVYLTKPIQDVAMEVRHRAYSTISRDGDDILSEVTSVTDVLQDKR